MCKREAQTVKKKSFSHLRQTFFKMLHFLDTCKRLLKKKKKTGMFTNVQYKNSQ